MAMYLVRFKVTSTSEYETLVEAETADHALLEAKRLGDLGERKIEYNVYVCGTDVIDLNTGCVLVSD